MVEVSWACGSTLPVSTHRQGGPGTVGNTVSLIGDLVEYGHWLVVGGMARETGHVCN